MKAIPATIALCSIATMLSAQTPVITELAGSGSLTWTNVVPYAVYRVEWASTPDGPWYSSWGQLASVSGGNTNEITVSVPMCFRVIYHDCPAPNVVLLIEPTGTDAVVNVDGEMLAVSCTNGFPPYTWSVADVFRGHVSDSAGSSALYQRSSSGDNAIRVDDSRGNVGHLVVKQP